MNIDHLWLLISILLVFTMIPGLGLFYGGFTRSHSSVSTILKSMVVLGPCTLLWPLVGDSLVFGEDHFGLIGSSFERLGLELIYLSVDKSLFSLFQMLFSLVAVAIISGAIIERVNFKFWLFFAPLWLIVIYYPVAHWVWQENGWIAKLGGLDFAGGLVVHVTSGFSAVVLAKALGRRLDFFKLKKSYNVGLIFIGTAMLWIGWFGFNAGSAVKFNSVAVAAVINTLFASSGAIFAWILMDYVFTPHRVSAKGIATAIICGLVSITPSAGYVSLWSAILIGIFSAILCNFLMRYFHSVVKIDDSLDVFVSHGVSGAFGSIMVALFARSEVASISIANMEVLKANLIGTLIVAIYSMLMTWILVKGISKVVAIRVSEDYEKEGLDISLHGENILVITKSEL